MRDRQSEVYRWFMELFIDAFDWVMVPIVYGMSQHADGGLITTKPYICGASYVLKMSRFRKGPWCEVWERCTGDSSTVNGISSRVTRGCQ